MNERELDMVRAAVAADIRSKVDERGQMGIGELSSLLKAAGASKPVHAAIGDESLGSVSAVVRSYRGYYEQLAIEPGEVTTAGELASALDAAVGATFYGYKGGNYTMSRNTPVWFSGYGEATGCAITGVVETDRAVVLMITEEEW